MIHFSKYLSSVNGFYFYFKLSTIVYFISCILCAVQVTDILISSKHSDWLELRTYSLIHE